MSGFWAEAQPRVIAETLSEHPEFDPLPPGLRLMRGLGDTMLAVGVFTEQVRLFGPPTPPIILDAPTLWNGTTQATMPNYFAAQFDATFEMHWTMAGDPQDNPEIDFDNMNYISAGHRTFRTDSRGGVLLAGTLFGQITFGQGSIGLSEDDGDSFVARYHPGGFLDWVEKIDVHASGDADFYPAALALMPDGEIVLAMGLSGKVEIELADGSTHELESTDEECIYTYYLLGLCGD
jgi:hypothetical protein